MNRRKLLASVVRNMRKQKCRAVGPMHICRYRIGNLKCAIGWEIPDNLYNPLMEGYAGPSINVLFDSNRFPEFVAYFENKYGEVTTLDIEFLRAVQWGLHDTLIIFNNRYIKAALNDIKTNFLEKK